MHSRSAVLAALALVAFPSTALADQAPQTNRAEIGVTGPRPVATARRVTETPTIDGLLDEPVWQLAAPLTDFVQADPLEGQPASERTEVRILYDDNAIFVGVICYDSDPSQIITTDTRRDAGLD